jgi:cold shock CspA family protein
MTQHAGRITWFNQWEGYGFLTCEHEADVFFDLGSVERKHHKFLKPGDWVQFELVDGEMGPTGRTLLLIRSERGTRDREAGLQLTANCTGSTHPADQYLWGEGFIQRAGRRSGSLVQDQTAKPVSKFARLSR